MSQSHRGIVLAHIRNCEVCKTYEDKIRNFTQEELESIRDVRSHDECTVTESILRKTKRSQCYRVLSWHSYIKAEQYTPHNHRRIISDYIRSIILKIVRNQKLEES